ncbi:MAG: I78 family peptidase inhibitor [Pseudomonadota bacterium]
MKQQATYLLPTIFTALLCLLSACAQQTPATAGAPPSASAGGECRAPGAQFAVGRNAEAALVEQARQRSGAYMARVIRPGQPVTLDYNLQRLNLDVDAGNRITRAHCG